MTTNDNLHSKSNSHIFIRLVVVVMLYTRLRRIVLARVADWIAPWSELDFYWIPFSMRLSLQKIEKPFLSAVETTLGDRYTENVEGIYKMTIKFIIQTLVDGFEKSSSSANNHVGGGAGYSSNSNSKPSWTRHSESSPPSGSVTRRRPLCTIVKFVHHLYDLRTLIIII